MKRLDYLPSERLQLLPESYWLHHEFCFYLHDSVLNLLIQYDKADKQNLVYNSFIEVIKEKNLAEKFKDKCLLDILKSMENPIAYKKHILGHTILALTSDMLHFLYEALSCIEKRKFSVAFSLLRKPFKEHLFFLSWILADEDDFIRRFESDNYKSFNFPKKFNQELRKKIIADAISRLHSKEAFDEDLIFKLIYSKNHEYGFEPTWQRATHLTTSMGDLLRTEDYSFNFIFENPSDDYYFDFLEGGLPYLMFYLMQVALACFNKIHVTNDKTVDHLIYSSLCVFECISDDKPELMDKTQEMFKEFLKCIHCNDELLLNKDNFSRILISEKFNCNGCKLENEFPFYWLLAQAKLSLVNNKR